MLMESRIYVSPKEGNCGEGCYHTIAEAVKSIPLENKEPVTIVLEAGIYREKLVIDRPYITLCGEGEGKVTITWGDYADKRMEDGDTFGTFRSYTVFVNTHDFTAAGITFENSAGPVGQALAMYADGDRLVFDHCRFLGYQDTLFTGPLPPRERVPGGFKGPGQLSPRINGRQYYKDCYIAGSTDFIFGSATAYFENCEIVSRKPGYVTAASTPEGQEYGYVFESCRLTAEDEAAETKVPDGGCRCPEGSVYLGRPWREYAKTVFLNCRMDGHIRPEGWHDWNKPEAHDTIFYAEYNSFGKGTGGKRAEFAHEMTADQAVLYTKKKVLGGSDGWEPAAGSQYSADGGRDVARDSRDRLWYDKPASQWHEALPIGNGRMGGMVFGGIQKERIGLNEDSIWYGRPLDRINPDSAANLPEIRRLIFEGRIQEAERLALFALSGTPAYERIYQTMGSLELTFDYGREAAGYERELDLETGIAETVFSADGVRYTREAIASFPDQVIALRLRAEGGVLNFHCNFSRGKFLNHVWHEGDNIIGFDADTGDGAVAFCGMAGAVCPAGGRMRAIGEFLIVEDAPEAVIYIAAATTFRVANPAEECRKVLSAVLQKSWQSVKADHIADYRELYGRVSLDLGGKEKRLLTTDRRLEALKDGDEEKREPDPDLAALYYQYGRYLLIACSRPGSLPANLQGIWNDRMDPPWDGKYTININTEMNYWPAETANLPECHEPLFALLKRMAVNGALTARRMYGCRGFVAHHNTDLYADTAPQDQYIPASYWVMGGAWLALHIWEHYLHTQDMDFLRENYPILRDSVLFFHDFLIEDEEGRMVTCPSVSPENTYILEDGTQGRLCAGPAMDSQILYELFHAFLDASGLLGITELTERTEELLGKLPKPQIGKHGQIVEWLRDYEEKDPGHRHISQLFAVYPGSLITDSTPELLAAARNTLVRRLENGGGHTGWSRAWIILLWSRFGDGEKAHENLQELLKRSTFPNLFDNHPSGTGYVFQIDGNFGATQGIAEMLVQSHGGTIRLLPALPAAWRNGEVKGLKLRGNIELRMSWKDTMAQEVYLKAQEDKKVAIIWDGRRITADLVRGKWVGLKGW